MGAHFKAVALVAGVRNHSVGGDRRVADRGVGGDAPARRVRTGQVVKKTSKITDTIALLSGDPTGGRR
jgi:hypothetical protein